MLQAAVLVVAVVTALVVVLLEGLAQLDKVTMVELLLLLFHLLIQVLAVGLVLLVQAQMLLITAVLV
jgi:hypothetical protein